MKSMLKMIIILILSMTMSILLILPENTVKVEAKLGKAVTSNNVDNVKTEYMKSHKK